MNQRLSLYSLILLLHLLWVPCFADSEVEQDIGKSQKVETLIKRFEAGGAEARTKAANEFFQWIYEEGLADEQYSYSSTDKADSVGMNLYYWVAEYYYETADYQTAADYAEKSLRAAEYVADDAALGDIYGLRGACYFRLGDFDRSVEELYHCYEIDKQTGDADMMSSSLNGIASVLIAAKRPEEAEKYMLEALSLNTQTNNLKRRAVLLGNTSEMYHSMGKDRIALIYATQALEIEEKLGNDGKVAVRLAQVASAELSLGEVESAEKHLSRAIPMLREAQNDHSMAICLNQMGDIMLSKNKKEDAARYYGEAAVLLVVQGDIYNEQHARDGLYRALKDIRPEEALAQLEISTRLKDSIYSKETGDALGKYNAVYYNDLIVKQKEKVERRNRIILIVSSSVALLVAVIVLVIVLILRKRELRHKKREKELIRKYEQVNEWYQNTVSSNQASMKSLTDDDKLFLQQLADAISQELEEGDCNLEQLSTRMRTNVVTLRRRLSDTLDTTPQNYIRQVRMQKARYLLENYRDMTVAEVAERCGYSQIGNFTRAYQNYYGISPTAARGKQSKSK